MIASTHWGAALRNSGGRRKRRDGRDVVGRTEGGRRGYKQDGKGMDGGKGELKTCEAMEGGEMGCSSGRRGRGGAMETRRGAFT